MIAVHLAADVATRARSSAIPTATASILRTLPTSARPHLSSTCMATGVVGLQVNVEPAVVWPSGSGVGRINEVALRRAR